MGNFGIGLYQPVVGGSSVNGGGNSIYAHPNTLISHPWSGVYGGTYGYRVDTSIPPPNQVMMTPAAQLGIDTGGIVIVRGYPQLTWSWGTLRPDRWYQLFRLYKQSAQAPIGFQFLVLLQYPDPTQTNGSITQILARWEPPTHSNRDVGAYYGVTLQFTYLGQLQLNPGVLIVPY